MSVKRIAWALVVVGLVTLLLGVYQLSTPAEQVPLDNSAFSFSTTQLLTFAGMTAISLLLIGFGGYLAGRRNEGRPGNHFTLDFTRKMDSVRPK